MSSKGSFVLDLNDDDDDMFMKAPYLKREGTKADVKEDFVREERKTMVDAIDVLNMLA
jgi:hypothetical protein